MTLFFPRLTSRPLFISTAFTPRCCHYDNCQFYFRKLTTGAGVRAKRGWEREEETTAAWFIRPQAQRGSNHLCIGCQRRVGVRHFTSRAAAIGSKTGRHEWLSFSLRGAVFFSAATWEVKLKLTERVIWFQQPVEKLDNGGYQLG